MEEKIEKILLAVGKSHLSTRDSYPGAGNLIEPPYTCPQTSLWAKRPTKLLAIWGGKLAEHAAAQEDSWQRILGFLECPRRGPAAAAAPGSRRTSHCLPGEELKSENNEQRQLKVSASSNPPGVQLRCLAASPPDLW
ncbi:hypothetical protein AOLI_G00246110 [Acnodon oligacanthus]